MTKSTSKIYLPLKDLYKKAKEQKLQFYHVRHKVWFTPDELAKQNSEGRYKYAESAWRLKPSNLKAADRKVILHNFEKKMKMVTDRDNAKRVRNVKKRK